MTRKVATLPRAMAMPPRSTTSLSSMTSSPELPSTTTWPSTISLSSSSSPISHTTLRSIRRCCSYTRMTSPSISLLEVISKTKTLLNSISGEVMEEEIFVVLGANGSSKSILIDALANCIMWESR
ncbi:hypothetical protein BHE74_00050742 [Ensete ventricosum]|nr:hypothetical protein GW17_00050308 [Ensete ventricosum]RWW43567.1 hypothetical protein BHE74_00050742 [Ensete ventricosum]